MDSMCRHTTHVKTCTKPVRFELEKRGKVKKHYKNGLHNLSTGVLEKEEDFA